MSSAPCRAIAAATIASGAPSSVTLPGSAKARPPAADKRLGQCSRERAWMQSASEQPRGHRGQGCRSVQGKPEWSHGFIFRRVLRRFACGRHCGSARVGGRLVEVVDQDRGAVLAEQA